MSEPAPRLPADGPEGAARAVLTVVDDVAREIGGGQAAQARLDSRLDRDLGLDSLARVELGARLEAAAGLALGERALFEAETPRDLVGALQRASGRAPLRVQRTEPAEPAADAAAPPEDLTTLDAVLAWHTARHGDRPHVRLYDDYTDGEVLSYAALESGASRVAAGLQAQGLEPGERVALMLPTGRDYFFAFFGAMLAGGVPVPIYPPVRRAQLEDHLRRQSRILATCEAACLVTNAEAERIARLLGAAVSSLRHVTTVPALEAGQARHEPVPRAPDDTAFLQYTSGSTGDPKGVVLSHANLLANVRGDGRAMAARPADTFVSWLPLYHDMGLIGAWFGSLYHAVPLVIMPPLTFLAKPARWLWAMHRHGGTLSAAPNFAYELCVKRIADADLEGLDLSRWRVAANGAEAISVRTLDAFCARFAPFGFAREAMMPVYGLAECAVGLAFPPVGRGPVIDRVDREALARTGRALPAAEEAPARAVLELPSCGLPLPGHEIRVVDAAGRELPERAEGRLQFRGPSATSGYFNRPDATAALFDDGWLETGDRAYLARGELHVTGRVKDIIIRAGRNIYPAELEDAVGDLEGVRKGHVAVFGSPDPDSGTERVVVLAETRRRDAAARESLERAITALAADLIASPPDAVVLVPPNTVLRTSSGKIRRSACRALYEQGRLGDTAGAVWLQVLRLAVAGVGPQLARAGRALAARAWALWCWAVFVPLALAAWLAATLPLPPGAVWRATRGLARMLAWLTGTRIEVSGLENLPGPDRPAVLVSNHQSYLDGMLLLAVLPRPARFLVKGELAGSRMLAGPLRRLGVLFVERFDHAGGLAGLREAVGALRQGALLAIFPEGTFKRMPGVLPFHLGAFSAAAEAEAPLVPVAIRGTRSILRAGGWTPHRGRIAVAVGAPVQPGGRDWTDVLALRDAARAHVLAHAGEPDLAHESNAVDRA